jgi:serine/threonine-protein kinase RsbW
MSERPISAERVIPSELSAVRPVQAEIEEALQANRFTEKEIFCIRLALEEALINAIKHGNQLDREKSVNIRYTVTGERFDISITDEGPGFDPNDVPDPTLPENLDRPCGRGVFMIKQYMTEVQYQGRGNVLSLSKVRNGKK